MSTPQERFRGPSVEATIEQIRYWVPSISDVARILEARDGGSWLLSLEPHLSTACPVAIALKQTGRFDISLAGETYEDLALESLDELVALLERIVEGAVVRRRWFSTATGAQHGIETHVRLGAGLVFRNGPIPGAGVECSDHHFLAYRRQL